MLFNIEKYTHKHTITPKEMNEVHEAHEAHEVNKTKEKTDMYSTKKKPTARVAVL